MIWLAQGGHEMIPFGVISSDPEGNLEIKNDKSIARNTIVALIGNEYFAE